MSRSVAESSDDSSSRRRQRARVLLGPLLGRLADDPIVARIVAPPLLARPHEDGGVLMRQLEGADDCGDVVKGDIVNYTREKFWALSLHGHFWAL